MFAAAYMLTVVSELCAGQLSKCVRHGHAGLALIDGTLRV